MSPRRQHSTLGLSEITVSVKTLLMCLTESDLSGGLDTVASWCSVKKVFIVILQNSQENTCARVSSLLKLQASGLQLYQKGDCGAGVFL